MVCNRCITAVQNELLKLDLHPIDVQMGIVKIEEEKLDKEKFLILNKQLNTLGFELLDKGKSRVIEQIKNLIQLLLIDCFLQNTLPSTTSSTATSTKKTIGSTTARSSSDTSFLSTWLLLFHFTIALALQTQKKVFLN